MSEPEWGRSFLPSDPPEGRETTSSRQYLQLTGKLVHQTKETFQRLNSSATMITFLPFVYKGVAVLSLSCSTLLRSDLCTVFLCPCN